MDTEQQILWAFTLYKKRDSRRKPLRTPTSLMKFSSHLSASLSLSLSFQTVFCFLIYVAKNMTHCYIFFLQPRLRLDSLGLHSKMSRKGI